MSQLHVSTTQSQPVVDSRWKDRVRFPALSPTVDQHQEYCEIRLKTGWTRVGMHDYAQIYSHPGLYEALFYELLECDSPRRVVGLLDEVRRDTAPGCRRILDVGAGNGLVGEALRRIGAEAIYAIDILPEARAAAERDRPGLYHDYLVADLCNLSSAERERLAAARFDCMTCVAALGFGDIPHQAFISAVNLVADGGLIAFNIKDAFLDARYTFGFSALIRTLMDKGIFRQEASRRYRHRLSSQGVPLYYQAIVARKMGSIPADVVD